MENFELIIQAIVKYLPPELIVIALAVYIIGWILKQTEYVKDKFIPVWLVPFAMVLTFLWYGIVIGLGFTLVVLVKSIIYGLFETFAAVYANQFFKQLFNKKEE